MFFRRNLPLTLGIAVLFALPTTRSMLADLKVEETSGITGGMMDGLSKMAGVFGAKSLNNTATATYVKGDRLRKDTLNDGELTSSEIIQLDQEQIVQVDHKKRTYSVATFAEIRARMEKAMEEMKRRREESPQPQPTERPTDSNVKVEPKIEIKDTGESKVINGFQAKHMILTIMFEGEDQKTKEKGAMGTNMDLWLTKDTGGFEERNQFYVRYAKKMANPAMLGGIGMGPAMSQDPRMGEAAQALSKKAKALEGIAVLTITSFDISGTPGSGASSNPPSSRPQTSKQQSETPESVGDAIGKALGGFGGFGHKKKKAEEPQQPPPTQPSSASGGTASLMTMTTELKTFSRAGLDPSLFEIPAGYRLGKK